ncbi:hypothetical protein ASC65_07465 [Brevundimonas sp. Root1279]|nr:hypothetical protein ASC65_07465 [Brevundimonas sp. Root1279]
MIAAACGAMALAGAAQAQAGGRATIVVRGEGRVEAMPDTFAMSAQVVGRGATQSEAVRQLALSQTTVTDAVSRLQGLTAAEVTTGLPAVTPTYSGECARDTHDKCTPSGYVAVLEVTLEGMPAERGGDAVSLAAERGAQSVRLTRLFLADETGQRSQAARVAFTDARRQAEDIATASGQRIVRVAKVASPDRQRIYGLYNEAEVDAYYGATGYFTPETSLDLSPDAVSISSSLEVTFEIE